MIFKDEGNGARLVIENTDRFKMSSVTLNFALPLCESAPVYSLLTYVLCNSCGEYKTYRALHERLDYLYGASISIDISKSGDAQLISVSVSSIDDRFSLDKESIFENAISLLFSIIFSPNLADGEFLAEEIETQKRMMKERIESELSDKRSYAMKKCEEYLFRKEKAGIRVLGNKEDVDKITSSELAKAYKTLTENSVMLLSVVASCNEKNVENAFVNQLKKINRKPFEIKTKFVPFAESVTTETENMDVTQAKLVMGYRTGMRDCDDNFYAYRVMTDIFGGSPNSKLFLNVREKQGLCYYCGARLSAYKGVIFVQSGVENENREKAIKEINKQLDDVRNGDFTDTDIAYSQASLLDSFRSVSDSPDALDRFYSSQIADEKIETPDEFVKGFDSVTREQIVEAAKKVTLDTVYMLFGGEEK